MKTKNTTKTQLIMALIAVALLFGSGCGEGMKWKPVYNGAMFGALVGGIVGYQSDETGEGVALGASLFALGEILEQTDKMSDNKPQPQPKPAVREVIKETYIVEIHNDNGSITPVEIRKEGDVFIGPSGERYEKLPTEAELKPAYGL